MGKRIRSITAAAAIAVATSSVFQSSTVAQAIPSFSGADGAGAGATGGRGGVVYHVTRLDTKAGDNTIGTLQYGCSDANFKDASGNVIARTIVFDVGGTIWLGNRTTDAEAWDTTSQINVGSNVTIAGQTAPGGITIAGGTMKVNGNQSGAIPNGNDVIRNVTLAPGYGARKFNSTSGFPDLYTRDAMDVNSAKVMVDHVTAVFATDETISAKDLSSQTTVQYSTIAQGQNYPQQDAEATGVRYTGHALGSLVSQASNSTITFSHNLYAQLAGRLPAVQTETTHLVKDANGNYVPGYTDFRNNVVYNWLGNAGYGSAGEPGNINLVGNYYRVGPGGDSASGGTSFAQTTASGGTTVFSGSSSTQVYQAGNQRLNLNGTTTSLANSDFGASVFQAAANGVTYFGATDSALAAYGQVLNYAGANWNNRGAIDARLVAQTRSGTGKITAFDDPTHGYDAGGNYVNTADNEWNKLLALRSSTNGGTGATGALARSATFDTDGDGMPDAWEAKNGLDPLVADNNGDFDADGYTNLEEYVNELAEWPASRALVFTGTTNARYAQITNWDLTWEPNKYDAARIVSGTAIVDAVGQHARTIAVGDTAGQAGTLNVTAGWIDVAETLVVGGAGTGTVRQSGGAALVGTSVTIANNGTYALTGGSLATPLLTRAGNGAFSFIGGTLNAAEVTFDLTVAGTGTLAPGLGVGMTVLDGKLTMNDGALEVQLASASVYDTLVVAGVATLDGELRVLAGYAPTAGTTWTILTAAGGIVGNFDAITPGYAVSIVGNTLVLSLASVPEPTSLAAIVGVGAIATRRRRAL